MCVKMDNQKTHGIYLEVVVKANSKKTKVPTYVEGNTIYAKIKSPPRHGKANKELLRELGKLFKVDHITIVSGHTSTRKTVFLEISQEKVKAILSQF